MLIGSLPVAYAISGGSISPLDFDSRQAEEVFLTASQSLFAVAILLSLTMTWWEAIALAGLFSTQLFFTDPTIRTAYGAVYLVIAVLVLARDVPRFPNFLSAARETAFEPHLIKVRNNAEAERPPPGRSRSEL